MLQIRSVSVLLRKLTDGILVVSLQRSVIHHRQLARLACWPSAWGCTREPPRRTSVTLTWLAPDCTQAREERTTLGRLSDPSHVALWNGFIWSIKGVLHDNVDH